MQYIYRGQPERIYTTYKDASGTAVDPIDPKVTIRFQDDSIVVDSDGVTLNEVTPSKVSGSTGVYYWDIKLRSDAPLGYYGAFWSGVINGEYTFTEVPQVFRVVSTRISIKEAVLVRGMRDKLLMQPGVSQYQDKFPDEDAELRTYIQNSIDQFNFFPPIVTSYNADTLPEQYFGLIELGGVIWALIGLSILEAGKHFAYSDNGISITRDRSGKYSGIWTPLLTSYLSMLEKTKKVMALSRLRMEGQFSSTVGYPRSLDRALRGVRKWF